MSDAVKAFGNLLVAGSIGCSDRVSVSSSNNYSFGSIGLNRSDGQVGATFGEGNGNDEIALNLNKANRIRVSGGTFTVDKDLACGDRISVTSSDNYSFGSIGLSRADGQTGAAIGNGNGNNEINIDLQKANKLNINGGTLAVNNAIGCRSRISVTSNSNYSFGSIGLNRADGQIGATLGNGNGNDEIALNLDKASILSIAGGSVSVSGNISHNGYNIPIVQTGTTATLNVGSYGQITSFPKAFPGVPLVITGNAAVVNPANITANGFDAKARENSAEGRNVPYIAIYFPT